MGFRNNITSDYSNYEILYYRINEYVNANGLLSVFSRSFFSEYLEPGYALLNIFVKYIFNDVKWLFVLSAIIIVFPIFYFAKNKNSPYLFIFLYISLGTYFEGFNIMRQMIAASILLLSFNYVKSFKTFRVIFFTFLASLFHLSSIVFIAYYLCFYIFNKTKKLDYSFKKIALIVLMGVIVFAISPLTNWYINNFRSGSYSYVQGITSMKITNALFPLFILVITEVIIILFGGKVWEKKKTVYADSNYTSSENSIYETGMYLWTALEICIAQIPMITRFASFLCPYGLVYIDNSFCAIKDKDTRRFLVASFVIVLFVYKLIKISGGYLDNYHLMF